MAAENFKVKKGLEVRTGITANSDGVNVTGIITATQFKGDGSGLTGVVGSGSGVVVKDEGSAVGTAGTINFVGSGVAATLSAGTATVTINAGGLNNVVEDTTPQLGGNLDLNSKFVTGSGNIDITGSLDVSGIATVGTLKGAIQATTASFSGAIDANGDLDVDGQTNLDDVRISGVTTMTGALQGTTGTFSGNVSGNQGTFSGNITGPLLDISPSSGNDATILVSSGGGQNNDFSRIRQVVSDDSFVIENKSTGSYETFFKGNSDRAAELHYQGNKKLETLSSGAKVTGDLEITGNIINNSKTYTITNLSTSHYVIGGEYDPNLYFTRGRTYILNMNASGHPLHIQTVSGQYDSSNLYTTGITVVGGRETGTITFSVPSDAPDLLYYVCENHSAMNGQIIISDIETPAAIKRNRGKIEIKQTVNSPASGDKQDELEFTTGFTDASNSAASYTFAAGHVDYNGRWFIGPMSGGKTYHGNGLEDGTSLIISRSYDSSISDHAVLNLNNRSPQSAAQLGSIYFSGYQNCFEGGYIRGIPTGTWGNYPNYRATAISFGLNGYGVNGSSTTTMVERFRFAASGALCVNGASNYGSSGQVLTSNGDAPPTWQASSGSSSSRTTTSQATGSIAQTAYADITISTPGKAFALLKVAISAPAWVILYTDASSRTSDAAGTGSGRSEGTDPTPGSGVLAEVSTTTSGASTFNMTPGLIGWNNDGSVSTNVYAKVVNKSGSTGAITVTLHYVTIES